MEIKEAILLCGGKGTRLRPLTENVPKALVEYKGKPLLLHQMEWLAGNDIKKIVLATGYMSEKIEKYVSTLDAGLEIFISKEDKNMGTAGGLNLAMKKAEGKRVLVANVDCLNDIDIKETEKIQGNLICLSRARLPFGSVVVENGIVKEFREKPLLSNVWVNTGIYVLERSLELPEKGSLEYDVFPRISLRAYCHEGYWKTIDSLKDLE